MTFKIWKVGLVHALLFSVTYASTDEPYSYSWQERPRNDWENIRPILDFHSQRVGLNSNDGDSVYEKLLSVKDSSLPTYIRHTLPYLSLDAEFENPDIGFIRNHEDSKEVPIIRGEVDVSRERMGGFGGTGDVLGYGAYEYKKSNNEDIQEIPFTEILRVPKSRGTFIDRFLDDHPLQNL